MTVDDLEVRLVGLEQAGRHPHELLPERARGLEHRGAAVTEPRLSALP